MTQPTRHDLVVFGATSFVGQILCRYLVDAHSDLDWAMAGRSADKLETVAEATGADVERIVADANDADAMGSLAASARLVVSTVGPYALYGSQLVAAVVDAGIDYCDLTGEPQWMQRMIDEHHDRAVETGARIVHACGFDSVPSDLGVWFLQSEAERRFAAPCTSVRMGVKAVKGGASGGTVASMMNLMEEAAGDPELRTLLANPYALAPVGDRDGVEQPDISWPEYDDGLRSWQAPFVMAATNTRVVFRTHALAGHPWGDEFTYGESMLTGEGLGGRSKAMAVAGAMGGVMGAAAFGPVRSLLGRALPEPGEGPSPAKQLAGFYDLRFHGTTDAGDELDVKVTGDQDPGYGSTAKILGEAAVCMLGRDHALVGGGFWTPATAMGDELIEPLRARAGLTFDVV
jgi:short subunit dehydrogenase-like uncharacterized protein